MSQLLRPISFSSFGEVLYLTEELRDLTVVVHTEASPWKFPAHKLVLASESPVLRAQLEDETVSEVVLDGITPSTAELFLRYIYRGEMKVENWNEGIDLLKAAFKFEVSTLVQKCGRFLENVVYLCNVCYIYNVASACSLPVLQDKCLKLILDAGFIALRSPTFEVLNKDCVMDIVASPDLNIDSELVVFETLFRWARVECCRTGQPITEANILTQVKPFLQHVCIDDMSDADKSALPPSILSCVKPNNRNRVGFSVLDSLLLHSIHLEFEINHNCLDFIGSNLSCFRFSVDTSIHLIGLQFTLVASIIPMLINIVLVKENTPKDTMFSHNLSSATSIESSQVNQRVWHDIKILMRQPTALKAEDIYNLYMVDMDTDAQLPRSIFLKHKLQTTGGYVRFTGHGEDMWGITSLIFL